MLTGVRTGIREKRISPDARLHIDNEIHAYLPGLCWNYEMGARFMQGTYQWAFPPEEQCCFVADPRIAAWVIDPRSFDVVPNGSESHSAAAKRIHAGKEIQYNTVGLLLAEEGKLDAAVAEYRKALVSKPDYAAAHYNLANVLAPRGEIRAAIDHYRRAIELKSRYLAAFVNLGGLFDRLGQTGEALACYQRALAIDAEHYTAHYNCANALRKLGDRDRAITHYHQALRIEPESHDARNNLGSLLFEQGRHDDALIEFEAANRIEPTARTHFNLGVLCIRLGRTDEGRGHFRRALSYAEEDGDRRLTARIQKALPD
jgi:tetratricopeptide (TPR) repeat protein